jgi:hypothetical protein
MCAAMALPRAGSLQRRLHVCPSSVVILLPTTQSGASATKISRLDPSLKSTFSEVVFNFEIPLISFFSDFGPGGQTPIDSASLTDLSLSQIT